MNFSRYVCKTYVIMNVHEFLLNANLNYNFRYFGFKIFKLICNLLTFTFLMHRWIFYRGYAYFGHAFLAIWKILVAKLLMLGKICSCQKMFLSVLIFSNIFRNGPLCQKKKICKAFDFSGLISIGISIEFQVQCLT